MSDPYVLLGVARSASQTEIKSAYRRLARRYHPDVNRHPAAAGRFAQITEAYHTLVDPDRRRAFDRHGTTTAGHARERSSRAAAAARAARRAQEQARVDRVVNEWLQREREDSKARGKAVYTTVTLFISTFVVAIMKPSLLESSTPFWRVALFMVFGVSVWHLFRSLREHFEYYTYRPERISLLKAARPDKKPFKRGVAWAFVVGGYLFSLTAGMLLGMLMEDISKQIFAPTSSVESMLGVFFYPPIAVLIVDMMYALNLHFEDL
jgi:hypothetical protein